MSALPLTPHLWHSPQSAGALARNLTNNFYYTVYAHFGLIWPDTLPKEVLSTLTANDQYPEPTAIPDNEFIQGRIKPAIKFLLPILRQLLMEQELQEGRLVEVDGTGGPGGKQDWHLSLASKLRKVQDELKLQDPGAMSIQKALRQHPTTLPQMINRLFNILLMIESDSGISDPYMSSSGQAEGSSPDLIDFTSPVEQNFDVAPTLGSPLLLTTPMNQVSWGDSDASDDETDEGSIISPQLPLESPYTEQTVDRSYLRSPSTAPTTPAKSPYSALGTNLGKIANGSHPILVSPTTPDVPTVILTVPTGSTDPQDDEEHNSGVAELKETDIPSPSSPAIEQNLDEDANSSRSGSDPALQRPEKAPRERNPYKTPERRSASLPRIRPQTAGQHAQGAQPTMSPRSNLNSQRSDKSTSGTRSPSIHSKAMPSSATSSPTSSLHDLPHSPRSPRTVARKSIPSTIPLKEPPNPPSLTIKPTYRLGVPPLVQGKIGKIFQRRAAELQVNPNGDRIGTGRRHESGRARILVGLLCSKARKIQALPDTTATLENVQYRSRLLAAVEPTSVAAKGQPAKNRREIRLEIDHPEREPTR
ncbi:hypothetical protein M407DRAFT_7232 [Tulasnella calospora MUT 4182]|uniref:Uncharacterized protein n=1 Tax=Tulasnella calospora MUT 4182 TaxID=1051891 RepID=A0A0C3M1G7_9AGAM|nr:hypothetical protein M407DRAFT_7232 [Tulasnella calospora MUT 4182]